MAHGIKKKNNLLNISFWIIHYNILSVCRRRAWNHVWIFSFLQAFSPNSALRGDDHNFVTEYIWCLCKIKFNFVLRRVWYPLCFLLRMIKKYFPVIQQRLDAPNRQMDLLPNKRSPVWRKFLIVPSTMQWQTRNLCIVRRRRMKPA